MSTFDDKYARLEALGESGQANSLEAIHLRDQLREAMHRAFMATIAQDFIRPDGSYPDWIAKGETVVPFGLGDDDAN